AVRLSRLLEQPDAHDLDFASCDVELACDRASRLRVPAWQSSGTPRRRADRAVACDAACGTRDRLRFFDPALGVDRAGAFTMVDRLGSTAGRADCRPSIRIADRGQPAAEGGALPDADDARRPEPGTGARASAHRAVAWVRARCRVVQDRAAADVSADPAACVRGAFVFAFGCRRRADSRTEQPADAGRAGRALVRRSRYIALFRGG